MTSQKWPITKMLRNWMRSSRTLALWRISMMSLSPNSNSFKLNEVSSRAQINKTAKSWFASSIYLKRSFMTPPRLKESSWRWSIQRSPMRWGTLWTRSSTSVRLCTPFASISTNFWPSSVTTLTPRFTKSWSISTNKSPKEMLFRQLRPPFCFWT